MKKTIALIMSIALVAGLAASFCMFANGDETRLRELVLVNQKCAKLFTSSAAKNSTDFADFSAFKNYLYENFTEKTAAELLENPLGGGAIYYKGQNGELMRDDLKIADGWYIGDFPDSPIIIDEQTSTKCIFYAKYIGLTGTGDGGVLYNTYLKMSASYENGEWKLDDVFAGEELSFPKRDNGIGVSGKIINGECIYSVNENPDFSGASVDDNVKSTVSALFKNNAEVVYNLFYLRTAAFLDKGSPLCAVVSDKYNSLNNISALLHKTYTEDIAKMLLEKPYKSTGNDKPLYVENNGALYIDKSVIQNHYFYLADWSNYSVKVNTADKSGYNVTVAVKNIDVYAQTGMTIREYNAKIVNTENGLRLAAVYTADPEYDGCLDIPVVDKAKLSEEIDKVKSAETDRMSAVSSENFKNALKQANDVLTSEFSLQSEVDSAQIQLKEAYEALLPETFSPTIIVLIVCAVAVIVLATAITIILLKRKEM